MPPAPAAAAAAVLREDPLPARSIRKEVATPRPWNGPEKGRRDGPPGCRAGYFVADKIITCAPRCRIIQNWLPARCGDILPLSPSANESGNARPQQSQPVEEEAS
jgi:hypothetical protein